MIDCRPASLGEKAGSDRQYSPLLRQLGVPLIPQREQDHVKEERRYISKPCGLIETPHLLAAMEASAREPIMRVTAQRTLSATLRALISCLDSDLLPNMSPCPIFSPSRPVGMLTLC